MTFFVLFGGIICPFYFNKNNNKTSLKFWIFPKIYCFPTSVVCLFFYILDNSYKVTGITVEKGGKNYLSAPDLVLVNTYTGKKVDSGILEAVFNPATQNNSITSVNIIEQPQGLQSVDHKVYALRNSNGVQVNKILSYSFGVVECQLTTPPLTGFVTPPFKPGDKIFVEGLVKGSDKDPITGITSSPGNGFNSTDNRYNFFEVVEYTNSNPATLKFDVAPFTSNAGNHRNCLLYTSPSPRDRG